MTEGTVVAGTAAAVVTMAAIEAAAETKRRPRLERRTGKTTDGLESRLLGSDWQFLATGN